MKPAIYDFSLVRGSTDGLEFRLKAQDGSALENIPFTDVQMTITDGAPVPVTLMTLSLSNGRLTVSDPTEAQIRWQATEHESRMIPYGPKARYEVEVRNGPSCLVYLVGRITGLGGANADEVTP